MIIVIFTLDTYLLIMSYADIPFKNAIFRIEYNAAKHKSFSNKISNICLIMIELKYKILINTYRKI